MNDLFISSRQLKARYGGVSNMTLWRWQRDESLGFPQPLVINGRRLWRLDALEAWEANQRRTYLNNPSTRKDRSAADA